MLSKSTLSPSQRKSGLSWLMSSNPPWFVGFSSRIKPLILLTLPPGRKLQEIEKGSKGLCFSNLGLHGLFTSEGKYFVSSASIVKTGSNE